MRPRSVGSFFTSRSSDPASDCAVSRIRSTSCRSRSPIDRRCRLGAAGGRSSRHRAALALVDEEHAVALVDLDELDLDPLVAPGREVLADEVGPDRQLAVAAVDEHCELHPGGAPVLEERVDRGADRATRVEDVVDEDDRHPLDREGDARRAHDGLAPGRPAAVANVDVVAVERDVERADGQRDRRCAPRPGDAAGTRAARRATGSRRAPRSRAPTRRPPRSAR